MTPSIDGVAHTFAEHGLYDGLFLMRDEETGTYWDHLTGEAVYGPEAGKVLEVANLLHSRAGQVLANHPDALIALSGLALRTDEEMKTPGLLALVRGRLARMFSSTIKCRGHVARDSLYRLDRGCRRSGHSRWRDGVARSLR